MSGRNYERAADFTMVFGWDPGHEWGLSTGYNRKTDETMAAIRLGPFVVIWGGSR